MNIDQALANYAETREIERIIDAQFEPPVSEVIKVLFCGCWKEADDER